MVTVCDIAIDCRCGTCDIDNVEYYVVGWCIDIGYRLDTVDIDMILLIDIGFCCRYDSGFFRLYLFF